MKLATTLLLGTLGMAATSATVWTVTEPAPAQAATAAPTSTQAQAPAVAGVPIADNGKTLAETFKPAPPAPPKVSSTFETGELLTMNGRLGHAALASATGGETFLFTSVTAPNDIRGGVSQRTPVNLSLAIDHSGSMKGQRLVNALAAARGMINRLRDGDSVSVVAFNSRADVLVPTTTISPATRTRLLASLQAVAATGHTCMSCGIEAGLDQLARRSGAVNRVLLLTDGKANRGLSGVGPLRVLAARARAQGVSISTLGVSADYDEDVLAAISKESSGRHHFIERVAQLPAVFDSELQSVLKTMARDAVMTVDLAPGVQVAEVFERTFRQSGTRLTVPLGTFTAGEEKTLLVRLQVPAGPAGARRVADVSLHYDNLATGGAGAERGSLAAEFVNDRSRVSALDPLVLTRVTRSQTVQALEEAGDLFDRGEDDRAVRRISSQLARVRKQKSDHAARAGADAAAAAASAPVTAQEDVLEEALGEIQKTQAQERESKANRGFGRGGMAKPAPRTLGKKMKDTIDPFG